MEENDKENRPTTFDSVLKTLNEDDSVEGLERARQTVLELADKSDSQEKEHLLEIAVALEAGRNELAKKLQNLSAELTKAMSRAVERDKES